jgi:hypothetical protein
MKSLKLMVILMVVLAATTALGATFNVTNPTEFQTALTTAAANNQDDTINVAAGTYNITATLSYQTDNGDGGHTITIQGAGAASTILSGGGTTQVMNINTDTGFDGGDAGGHVMIRALTFQNGNNAVSIGGGASIITNYANFTCENSIFTDNTAVGAGGVAVISFYGSVTFTDNAFSGNTLTSAAYGGGGGMAASSQYASVTLTGNTFSNNSSASAGGGAVVGAVAVTVTGNTFSGNIAASSETLGGGGISAVGDNSVIILSSNEFSNNSASSSNGGGASVFLLGSGTATITDNSFSDNSAALDGGGAWAFSVGSGSPVSLVRNTFSSNSASGQGGGAAILSEGDTVIANNNVFMGNSAATYGGGLMTASLLAANITNNTFFGNTASLQGGGIATFLIYEVGALNIYNNIFWNNTALLGGNDGDDVYVEADFDENGVGGPVNLFNNNFSGAANFASAQSEDLVVTLIDNYSQGGNIQQDPLFVNAGIGDVHLLSGSPSIDTGNNSAPSIPATDFEGGSRIVDGDGNGTALADMGADEFGSAAPLPGNAVNVPTLNEWGMIIFIVLAGIGSVYYVRKRQKTRGHEC